MRGCLVNQQLKTKQRKAACLHGVLALALGTARVDGRARQPSVEQVIIHKVHLIFAIHKDQRADRVHSHKPVVERLVFHFVISINDLIAQSKV